MKLISVKWKNHPILGNLELDFTNPSTGKPYSNIVFAGENGTGKSTILKTMNAFLCGGTITPFDNIVYEADNTKFKAEHLTGYQTKSFYKRKNLITGQAESIDRNLSYKKEATLADQLDPRSYGSILSVPRADYKTDEIINATSLELDTEIHKSDTEDNFTSIKQLFVDIEAQDDALYREINRQNEKNGLPIIIESQFERTDSKIYRFKKAFNNFFDKIQYNRVVTRNGHKEIEFTKNGQSIAIDNLSTGEKQIVFRGAYLLRNLNKVNGSTIMIDEPELSMHPKWQSKIFDFYTDLFKDATGNSIAQLFFCTHSEKFLSQALKDNDTLVIVLKEDGGNIIPRKITAPGVLPTITAAETNYLAFDVVSTDYHIQLYGWLQERENKTSVASADRFIAAQSCYDAALHDKPSSFNGTNYTTMSTYIRNAIDHPRTSGTYTEDELRISVELLREILK